MSFQTYRTFSFATHKERYFEEHWDTNNSAALRQKKEKKRKNFFCVSQKKKMTEFSFWSEPSL